MDKFKSGDRVRVINVDGRTDKSWDVPDLGWFGTVRAYDNGPWPVNVLMDDNSEIHFYNESELELIGDNK